MINELTHHTCGDYLIQDIQHSYDTQQPLGKYGRLWQQFLQENAPILYSDLVLTGQLFLQPYAIDQTAHQRLELIQKQLLATNPAPDKAANQMAWVRHMNMIKAEEKEPGLPKAVSPVFCRMTDPESLESRFKNRQNNDVIIRILVRLILSFQ